MKLQTFKIPCAHPMAAYGGPKVEIKTVKGYEQEICGIRCIVHHNPNPGGKFVVAEYSTGMLITTGRNRVLAIAEAEKKISPHKDNWNNILQKESNKLRALKVKLPLNL